MKRLLSICLLVSLLLVGCTVRPAAQEPPQEEISQENPEKLPEEVPEETPEETPALLAPNFDALCMLETDYRDCRIAMTEEETAALREFLRDAVPVASAQEAELQYGEFDVYLGELRLFWTDALPFRFTDGAAQKLEIIPGYLNPTHVLLHADGAVFAYEVSAELPNTLRQFANEIYARELPADALQIDLAGMEHVYIDRLCESEEQRDYTECVSLRYQTTGGYTGNLVSITRLPLEQLPDWMPPEYAEADYWPQIEDVYFVIGRSQDALYMAFWATDVQFNFETPGEAEGYHAAEKQSYACVQRMLEQNGITPSPCFLDYAAAQAN